MNLRCPGGLNLQCQKCDVTQPLEVLDLIQHYISIAQVKLFKVKGRRSIQIRKGGRAEAETNDPKRLCVTVKLSRH